MLQSCSIHQVGVSDHSLVQVSISVKNVAVPIGITMLPCLLILLSEYQECYYQNAFTLFWKNYTETKSLYTSLQQPWDI